MNQQIINTEKIVIETNFYSEKKTICSVISASEKIVFVNDEVVYKEWQKYPHFQNNGNTSVALNELEKQLLFRKQSKSAKQSRSYRRNFVQRVKLVWAKLLAKIVNFKT
jgi:hypothetical protein